jgi:chromosome segregation protein
VTDGLDLDPEGVAAPRLLALRLQGFKSFAERTNVEFGGGISAVVGPNGSGKSNLADALRWALGEQGRALRSRKAEDVIWAGSERRAAQGMADVTLVLDNADGLLPVDFQVLELGRRLYRSGENEYLLNKQRIRLRDLVDLLDAAHLADNAFLFIGQGMVDQALALRPEERRPLFEEVAGVRRHERRRRKAEEQLVESDANLARIDDILAELRPQARRLAAQAEQQATRANVGDELVSALLASAHGRWHEASLRARETEARRLRAQAEADRAMAELETAEQTAQGLAADLGARAVAERDRREAHDVARAALTAVQLRDGRVVAELDAIARDRARLADERAAAASELEAGRRVVAAPVPARDVELEAQVAEAERDLADALAELGTLRGASQARGEELAAVRRAEMARAAEAETARRRLDDAQRRLVEARTTAERSATESDALGETLGAARARVTAATTAEAAAAEARETARRALETAEAERAAAADRVAGLSASAASLRGRLEAVVERLAADERRPIARAAKAAGGRRIDDDLVVDPDLRAAVEAGLADRARAYLIASAAVPGLASQRGRLIVEERATAPAGTASDAATRRFLDAVAERSGGRLSEAIRRDGTGGARHLLARAVWVPDLVTALALQPSMPPGWIAVVRDGSAVVDDSAIALGAPDAILEVRAEHDRLTADLERADASLAAARASASTADEAAGRARAALEAVRSDEAAAATERRRADEAERAVARDAEALARETAWHAAQLERIEVEVARLVESVPAMAPLVDQASAARTPAPDEQAALATWERRAEELRERRDRLVARLATHDGTRRDAEHRRARAEAAVTIAEERATRAERDAASLSDREGALSQEREALRADVAAAAAVESAARAALAELHAADAADRTRLTDAERAAAGARERLRAADDRSRATDHQALEARLALDALHEGLLVELAGLGDVARVALGLQPSSLALDPVGSPDTVDSTATADTADRFDETGDGSDAGDLAAALATLTERWAGEPAPSAPPSPARLAQLRRRYHELGAANPFAVEEYGALKDRLETLETQGSDLRSAIGTTRDLIRELDTMIADQFRTTFAKLETAFERRFEQLFGGGFARLSLTDPSDLGSTGIEIVARPPGKKPQALAMLSGGERALTAVALLFAMLEVRPVPFCVLDEVDAALDEANIGRFSDSLRSLAHQTQFIVITHNRGTIEAADALYGVTVGDDSVSRVISLRLDEAKALASQRQAEQSATR